MSKLTNYRQLLLIVILAFAVRAAVRWHLGGADFWVNGYTFFFDLAQNVASGKGISVDGVIPPLRSAFPYTRHFLQR